MIRFGSYWLEELATYLSCVHLLHYVACRALRSMESPLKYRPASCCRDSQLMFKRRRSFTSVCSHQVNLVQSSSRQSPLTLVRLSHCFLAFELELRKAVTRVSRR